MQFDPFTLKECASGGFVGKGEDNVTTARANSDSEIKGLDWELEGFEEEEGIIVVAGGLEGRVDGAEVPDLNPLRRVLGAAECGGQWGSGGGGGGVGGWGWEGGGRLRDTGSGRRGGRGGRGERGGGSGAGIGVGGEGGIREGWEVEA